MPCSQQYLLTLLREYAVEGGAPAGRDASRRLAVSGTKARHEADQHPATPYRMRRRGGTRRGDHQAGWTARHCGTVSRPISSRTVLISASSRSCSGTRSWTTPPSTPRSRPERCGHRDQPARQARHVPGRRDRTHRLRRCAPHSRSPTFSVLPARHYRATHAGHPEPSSAQGHVGDRAVPHGGYGRSCRGLRGLWPSADQVPITAAATGTAPAPGRRRTHLAGRARGQTCCRSDTSTSSSAFRPNSPTSPSTTRRSLAHDLLFRAASETMLTIAVDRCVTSSARASASPPCCTPGARR